MFRFDLYGRYVLAAFPQETEQLTRNPVANELGRNVAFGPGCGHGLFVVGGNLSIFGEKDGGCRIVMRFVPPKPASTGDEGAPADAS